MRVSDDGRRLAWAEFHGNNQFVSTGNIDRDGRVCLFFIDYPLRRQLKVFGHARVVETDEDPALLAWVTGREEGSEGPTLSSQSPGSSSSLSSIRTPIAQSIFSPAGINRRSTSG